MPAFPVIQHLFPSRFAITPWVAASGGDRGRPCVITANGEYQACSVGPGEELTGLDNVYPI